MEAKAVVRTIRIAPHKVKLILNLIRGKDAGEAIAILKLINKALSSVIEKALMPALTNAEHNYDMNIDELVVKEAYANEGPTSKRLRPCAQGRASAINKRTSYIIIVVSDGKGEVKEA